MKEKLLYMHKIFEKGFPFIKNGNHTRHPGTSILIIIVRNFIKILFPKITLHVNLLGRMKMGYD